jgi:hypothetical protein
MRLKTNSAFFIGRNTGSYITAGQSYAKRIKRKRNRAPVMDIEFRRDEKGGSGGVFVE